MFLSSVQILLLSSLVQLQTIMKNPTTYLKILMMILKTYLSTNGQVFKLKESVDDDHGQVESLLKKLKLKMHPSSLGEYCIVDGTTWKSGIWLIDLHLELNKLCTFKKSVDGSILLKLPDVCNNLNQRQEEDLPVVQPESGSARSFWSEIFKIVQNNDVIELNKNVTCIIPGNFNVIIFLHRDNLIVTSIVSVAVTF